MTTNDFFPQASRKKTTVFILVSLLIMVFAAIVYRVENPSIIQQERQQQMPGQGAMGQMGDMEGISAMMKKLQDHPDDLTTMRSLGMAFMDMQAWERSLAFWDMILERNATDIMALNQKGFCLFELEKHAEAAEHFTQMLSIEPHNERAHFNLGILLKYYLHKPEEAHEHFQAVVDSETKDSQLLDNARRELED